MRKGRADARSYLQTFLALVGRRVREIGRKGLKRTLASAGRGQRARLRGGRYFVDSSIPRGSTEPISGGRVCQPGLSVTNFFTNGRKRLTEHIFPSLWRGSLAIGSSAQGPMPHTGSRRLGLPTVYCQCSKGDVSWPGSVVNLA